MKNIPIVAPFLILAGAGVWAQMQMKKTPSPPLKVPSAIVETVADKPVQEEAHVRR